MVYIASVFIVEDDIPIQVLYKKLLNFYGFDIVGTASNGEEAVTMYKSFPKKPDVILMDHRMPIKDGIKASKEILTIDDRTNIIFTSGDKSIREEALSMGITGFLDKPFPLEQLIKKIKAIINN